MQIEKNTPFSKDDIYINFENIKKLLLFIGSICETKNGESKEHIKRMQDNSEILALNLMNLYPEYNLTETDCKLIWLASSFHDIGKIKIPDYILNKPTKLTAEEFSIIKKHPVYGIELFNVFVTDEEKKSNKILTYIYNICLYHHERYDGKGYPNKIVGEEIPICAQIVGLIDVYDALLHEHVYRGAYNKKETLDMIVTGKCGKFNPKIIEAFKQSSLYT